MIDRRTAAEILMVIWPKAQVFVHPSPVTTLWNVDVAFNTAASIVYEIRLGVSRGSSGKLWVGHSFVTNEVPDTRGCKCFLSGNGTSDLIGYMSYLRTYGCPDEHDHRIVPAYDLKAPCINLYHHTSKLAEDFWGVPNQTPNCITVNAEGRLYAVTFYRPGESLARIKSLSGLKPYLDTPEAIEKEALKARCKRGHRDLSGGLLTQVPDPNFLRLDPDRLE